MKSPESLLTLGSSGTKGYPEGAETGHRQIGKHAGAVALALVAGTASAEGLEALGPDQELNMAVASEHVIAGNIPTPEISSVFQMDRTLPSVPATRSDAGEDAQSESAGEQSDYAEQFARALGFHGGGKKSEADMAPSDPLVLRLTRELEDPEGTFREGEVVMEGYQGLTEQQLRSLRKLSGLADHEFSFVFSRGGNGKFETTTRDKGGYGVSSFNPDAILADLQGNKDVLHVHTHPAQGTTIFIPSYGDLLSDAWLRQQAEQRGYDSAHLREAAAAPNGLWEYSVEYPYKPAGHHLLQYGTLWQSLIHTAQDEIERLPLPPESRQHLLDRFMGRSISGLRRDANTHNNDIGKIARAMLEKDGKSVDAFLASPSGKMYMEYHSLDDTFGKGETKELRDELSRWAEKNGLRITFTPYPESVVKE